MIIHIVECVSPTDPILKYFRMFVSGTSQDRVKNYVALICMFGLKANVKSTMYLPVLILTQ